jgi:hypothetical protein
MPTDTENVCSSGFAAQEAFRNATPGLIYPSPVMNLLAISGGAEDGAFGAGLLAGWGDAGTRPNSISKRDGIDFNLASIPPDFSEVRKEPFDAGYMNALFDRSYDLARHNYSWAKAPPGIESVTRANN